MERFKAFIEATRTFAREVVGELRKVVWPSRERIVKLTGVVVAMVAIVAGFLYLWDLGLGAAMSYLFRRG
ncbi:MAG: preprotein translocase subunit SecE [Bacillota bacterium]